MKGTDAQKAQAKRDGVKDWSPRELKEAAQGFTLDQYEARRKKPR